VIHIRLMKREIVVTHTIHQTEIPALLDIWVTNISSVKMLVSTKQFHVFILS